MLLQIIMSSGLEPGQLSILEDGNKALYGCPKLRSVPETFEEEDVTHSQAKLLS